MGSNLQDISKFFVAGINYKKTDASIRGEFAINDQQYASILQASALSGIKELFILSTCNRTEIYGFAQSSEILIELLCGQTEGDRKTFDSLCYIKNGMEAIQHLYNVGAGLDSQILGDYEIIGQIKIAVKFAKEYGFIGSYLERLVNSVIQASKNIKNQTDLSGGTVSVSFAAVQYIREKVIDIPSKSILLVGTGKIGRNTCKNIIDYLETDNITLINRTPEKARQLATELQLNYVPAEFLTAEIKKADIILVATNSDKPTILKSHLQGGGPKLIIDLSIPYNVEAAAIELENISLVNVDELSRLKDETLQKRQAEVPRAKSIIQEHIREFLEWHDMRKHVPVLRAVKLKLQEIHSDPFFYKTISTQPSFLSVPCDQEKIQKVINGMALKMRQQNQRGCHYIEAINEFMAPPAAN